jgi:hypothetical protein
VNVKWTGLDHLGMGFHDIQGLILSHLWASLLRDSHISFHFFILRHIFPNPLLAIYFACVTKLKTIRGTKRKCIAHIRSTLVCMHFQVEVNKEH